MSRIANEATNIRGLYYKHITIVNDDLNLQNTDKCAMNVALALAGFVNYAPRVIKEKIFEKIPYFFIKYKRGRERERERERERDGENRHT